MAPYPEELDVFTIPHSRMKHLVNNYCEEIFHTEFDFSNCHAVLSLLRNLHATFCEFMCHEKIENDIILNKLKKRLAAMSVPNTAVCNCHSDNRLRDMLKLVESGYDCTSKSTVELINYGTQLQVALKEFTNKFLPHMQEEEEVFQPLLMKYFEYDELKSLKDSVILQHEKIKNDLHTGTHVPETAESVKLHLDQHESEESSEDDEGVVAKKAVKDNKKSANTRSVTDPFELLPSEIHLKILGHVSVRDLLQCAQVSRRWNQLANDPSLWKQFTPLKWARGNWETTDDSWFEEEEPCGQCVKLKCCRDEDADVDESGDYDECCSTDGEDDLVSQEELVLKGAVEHLIARVGSGVQKVDLSGSTVVTKKQLTDILLSCPNVVYLDLSYTAADDDVFTRVAMDGNLRNLKHLDLSGCTSVTDVGMQYLAQALIGSRENTVNSSGGFLTGFCVNGDASHSEVSWRETVRHLDAIATCKKLGLCECNIRLEELAQLAADTSFRRPYGRGSIYYDECDVLNEEGFFQLEELTEGAMFLGDSCACGERNTSCCRARNDGERSQPAGKLQFLRLSGCFNITEQGILPLARMNLLHELRYLDVSGCWKISGRGLAECVRTAPMLEPEHLYYCDNITDGPYPDSANGCQNLNCTSRACCRLAN